MSFTTLSNEKKWYVGYTYPKYEKRINSRIQSLGLETYLPIRKELRQWSDRKKNIEVPLFPNYIFIKSKLNDLSELLQIEGLMNFISFAKQYATVKEDEIKAIKDLLSKSSQEDEWCIGPIPPKKGTKVEIIKGPFQGLTGELYDTSGKYKFFVRIDSLGQGITLEIPTDYLKY